MNQAMERLATGLRINSAADDAAGLAISSKMTSQINGLTQAVRNAQDAMSMLATADGAMIGVTDMIQRMRELSIQAISDTNTDSDRAALNLEYQALKSEIDRIAQNTQWNGRTFFDGVGFSEPATFQIGSEADQTITVNIGTLSTSQLGRVTNNDYMAHASAAPTGDITASTFVSHGSSVPTADNGTSYASHASAAPTESAYHSEFINHASSAPTTTAGTGYATHASSVPTTTATSTTFDVTTTGDGPSPLSGAGALATHQSTAPTPAVTQSVISTASAGSESRVNTTTTSSQEYPQTASLADGGYVVVWNSNNQDGSQYGVFGQRFNSSGAAVGGEFQANTYTAYHQTDSKVTATGDGGFLVTWTSTAPQDGSGYGVFAQRFNSSGTKVGAEFQVNTTTSTHQLHSNPTALSGGGFVVTWASNSQDGSGKGVYGQLYDASGASVGGEFKVNTHTNDDQYQPSVAALNGGGFVVSWMSNNQDGDSWGVYGQRYDASGNTTGSEFKVNTHTTSSQDYPAVTSLNDGGFVVTWHDDSGHDGSADGVFGQRYSSSGSATGSQFQINSTTAGTQAFSSITSLTDGGFVVTWTDYSGEDGSGKGIFGQRYDAQVTRSHLNFRSIPTPLVINLGLMSHHYLMVAL